MKPDQNLTSRLAEVGHQLGLLGEAQRIELIAAPGTLGTHQACEKARVREKIWTWVEGCYASNLELMRRSAQARSSKLFAQCEWN